MTNLGQTTFTMNSGERRSTRFGILLILWVGLIFATSSTVIRVREFFALVEYFTGAGPESIERFQVFWGASWLFFVKGWHFAEFAILTLLCVQTIGWWTGRIDSRIICISMALCILFAISDEWHQSFVPHRYGTAFDAMIDSMGVLTAGTILIVRNRKRPVTTPD